AVGAPVDIRGAREIGLGFGQRAHAIAGGAVADVKIAFRRERGDVRAEAGARGEPAIARRVGAARPPDAQLAGGTGRDQARRLFDLDDDRGRTVVRIVFGVGIGGRLDILHVAVLAQPAPGAGWQLAHRRARALALLHARRQPER